MSANDLKIGETVKAGTYILITSGEYSAYGVVGLFRAKAEFVVPSRKNRHYPKHLEVDVQAITTNPALVEEIAYAELHDEEA